MEIIRKTVAGSREAAAVALMQNRGWRYTTNGDGLFLRAAQDGKRVIFTVSVEALEKLDGEPEDLLRIAEADAMDAFLKMFELREVELSTEPEGEGENEQ